jgi:hypothetical protein
MLLILHAGVLTWRNLRACEIVANSVGAPPRVAGHVVVHQLRCMVARARNACASPPSPPAPTVGCSSRVRVLNHSVKPVSGCALCAAYKANDTICATLTEQAAMSRARCVVPVHGSLCLPRCCASRNVSVHARIHRGSVLLWQQAPKLRSARTLSLIARAAEDEEEYDPEFDAMERMDKSLVACEKELSGIRAGEELRVVRSRVPYLYCLLTCRTKADEITYSSFMSSER